MDIRDYIKVEEMKALLAGQLMRLGLKDRAEGALDADLENLIRLMSSLSERIKEKETDTERVQLLVNYILGLWGILLIDYNHDISEL